MLVVGIDLGGTNIKGALLSIKDIHDTSTYTTLKTTKIHTEAASGRDTVVANIVKVARILMAKKRISVIAVSSAGTFDWDTGLCTYATNSLPNFTGFHLYNELKAKLKKPIYVINDAVSALIGEYYFNKETAQSDSALMLTLGTGLGSAMIKCAEPLDSGSVENLTLAHLELHKNGRLCQCGKLGCAEQYVSATGLRKNYPAGLEELFDGVETTDKTAAINIFIDDFISVVKEAEKEYNPKLIIVGGGIVEIKEYWFNDFVQKAISTGIKTSIVPATLGNKAGYLGAIYTALNGIVKHQG